MFIALAFIFMGAYQISPGVSLLAEVFSSINNGTLQSVLIGAVVLGVIIGIIAFVTKKPKGDDD